MSTPQNLPFTNCLGDVLQPGDKCVSVTSGYSHNVITRKCTYLGLNASGNPMTEYIEKNCIDWYDPVTGNSCSWFSGCEHRRIDKTKRSSLQLGRLFKLA